MSLQRTFKLDIYGSIQLLKILCLLVFYIIIFQDSASPKRVRYSQQNTQDSLDQSDQCNTNY